MDTAQSNRPGRSALQTRHLYTLHGEIAWGGMASVRLARQTGPHGWSRIVAVKNLLARTSPDSEFGTMFRDEIRVASRVNHPNVVPVLDVVAADEQLLLVMEYVHGETVARLLKRGRTAMPPEIACTIMIGILRGLHAAHVARTERGEPLHIVHRDVTPHNMIVGVDGTPRLLDFGIAHAAGRSHQTRVGQMKGKLPYMAPEQFLGGPLDRRVDVYAAAVTLWEMLAGRRLFDGHKDNVMKMILHQQVQPPGTLQAGISSRLDAIVMCGLRREPRQRYETAREMALALERETATVSATELGDWVRQVWGAAGRRREEQISAIEGRNAPAVDEGRNAPAVDEGRNAPAVDEGRHAPAVDDRRWPFAADEDLATTDEPTKVEAPRRRLPSSLLEARPLPPPARDTARALRRQAPRVNTPTAAFGEQRRISALNVGASAPASAPRSIATTWAPMVLMVAGTLLVGHFWRGIPMHSSPTPRPLAGAAVPAASVPKVEPLPERAEHSAAEARPLSLPPPVPAREEAVTPAAAAAVEPARVRRPAQKGKAESKAEDKAAKRRTSRQRPGRRLPARPATDPQLPSLPAIRPGALVDPMGPPLSPARSP